MSLQQLRTVAGIVRDLGVATVVALALLFKVMWQDPAAQKEWREAFQRDSDRTVQRLEAVEVAERTRAEALNRQADAIVAQGKTLGELVSRLDVVLAARR